MLMAVAVQEGRQINNAPKRQLLSCVPHERSLTPKGFVQTGVQVAKRAKH